MVALKNGAHAEISENYYPTFLLTRKKMYVLKSEKFTGANPVFPLFFKHSVQNVKVFDLNYYSKFIYFFVILEVGLTLLSSIQIFSASNSETQHNAIATVVLILLFTKAVSMRTKKLPICSVIAISPASPIIILDFSLYMLSLSAASFTTMNELGSYAGVAVLFSGVLILAAILPVFNLVSGKIKRVDMWQF
jgi:hypothetical protein